jgi:hypothetical protein
VQDRPGRDVSRGTSGSRKSTPEKDEFDELTSNPKTTKSKMSRVKRRGPRRREQHLIVMDLFLALILCHNVTPVYTSPSEEQENKTKKHNGEPQDLLERKSESSDGAKKVKEF